MAVNVDQFRRNADYVEQMGNMTIRDEQMVRGFREAADEIEQLREYVAATEYWKIEPHDQKERTAFLRRLGV